MTILGGLVLLYIAAVMLGRYMPKLDTKASLVLVLITAAQVTFAVYQMFTVEVPTP
ncbi:MAG: hypothetical protein ACRDGA_00545 [Bacteroidota bacterium]